MVETVLALGAVGLSRVNLVVKGQLLSFPIASLARTALLAEPPDSSLRRSDGQLCSQSGRLLLTSLAAGAVRAVVEEARVQVTSVCYDRVLPQVVVQIVKPQVVI